MGGAVVMRLDPTVSLRTTGTAEEWAALEADAERFQTALGHVEELHRAYGPDGRCDECGRPMPCLTALTVAEGLG